MRKRKFCYLLKRDLSAGWSSDQDAAQLVDIVAEITHVANIDRIALAAFYVFSYIHAADSRRDGLLDVGNRQPILRGFGPIHLQV